MCLVCLPYSLWGSEAEGLPLSAAGQVTYPLHPSNALSAKGTTNNTMWGCSLLLSHLTRPPSIFCSSLPHSFPRRLLSLNCFPRLPCSLASSGLQPMGGTVRRSKAGRRDRSPRATSAQAHSASSLASFYSCTCCQAAPFSGHVSKPSSGW